MTDFDWGEGWGAPLRHCVTPPPEGEVFWFVLLRDTSPGGGGFGLCHGVTAPLEEEAFDGGGRDFGWAGVTDFGGVADGEPPSVTA